MRKCKTCNERTVCYRGPFGKCGHAAKEVCPNCGFVGWLSRIAAESIKDELIDQPRKIDQPSLFG